MDVYDMGAREVASPASVDAVLKQLGNQRAPLPAEWDRAEIAASSEPAVAAMAHQLGVRPDCLVNESHDTASLPTSALTAGFVRMLNAEPPRPRNRSSNFNGGEITP